MRDEVGWGAAGGGGWLSAGISPCNPLEQRGYSMRVASVCVHMRCIEGTGTVPQSYGQPQILLPVTKW